MALQELKDKRNKLMTDAGKLIQGKDVTVEQRNQFDAMMADVDLLEQDIAREQRVENFHTEMRAASRPPQPQPGQHGIDISNPDLQKRAFRDWMRTGQLSQDHRSQLQYAETRDLGVGAVTGPITAGNVLVPVGFDPQLNIARKSFGALVGAVRQFTTDFGGPVRVALADDTEQTLSLAYESTAVTESDPNLSGFTSNTDLMTTGLVKVNNTLLQDSAFDVDGFIQETFGQRYFRGLANMIAQGNGSNVQKLTPTKIINASTGETTAVSSDNLVDVYAALDPAYIENSSWLMRSDVRAALMKLKDNYGHSLLQPDMSGQPFNALFGRPIVISQGNDAMTANKTPIMFGDLAASYTLRSVAGSLQIARSTDRFFEYNETAFIGYCRVGGYNTSQSASSSLVGLTMAAS